ncbi:hypothetical protein T10_556 [Trichinella papuae]|uniref:Uncharacterized protein n=1 Tax=Trichinella papuae TaxID=268474 RepID=A0A0V1LZJ9_9BILA|nr:hypothetical protein T10_556 [Trichinella papuae]
MYLVRCFELPVMEENVDELRILAETFSRYSPCGKVVIFSGEMNAPIDMKGRIVFSSRTIPLIVNLRR